MDFNEDLVLKILALTIGTTTEKNEVSDNHLIYLLNKLYGNDGLNLDKENTELYEKLKKLVNY